jgi:anti-sigma28 factor (negative regulator of flagellin synthesis)
MEQQVVLPVVPDAGVSDHVDTLQRMHAQKVRTLMTSIHVLKEQLQVAKAASKEHRRSALIQQLRDAVRDGEAVVDVLRQALVDRGLDDRTVNELIIKRTCSGPKRFRPRSREELQRDCGELDKKVKQLEAALAKSKAATAAATGELRGVQRTQAVAAGQPQAPSPGGEWGGMFASPGGGGGSAEATPDRLQRAASAPGGTTQARRASNAHHAAIEAAPASALGSVGYARSSRNGPQALATQRGLTSAGPGDDDDDDDAVALGQEVSALQLEVRGAQPRASLGVCVGSCERPLGVGIFVRTRRHCDWLRFGGVRVCICIS